MIQVYQHCQKLQGFVAIRGRQLNRLVSKAPVSTKARPVASIGSPRINFDAPVAAAMAPLALAPTPGELTPSSSSEPTMTTLISSPSESIVPEGAPLADMAANTTSLFEPLTTAVLQIGDFKALGLAGWTPPGVIEHLFEYLYVTTGLPWWATITVATILIRLAVFPIFVKLQRLSARMMEIKPELEKIQNRMAQFKKEGDVMATQAEQMKMMEFMKDKKVNPLGAIGFSVIQLPLFISFFMAVRAMCEANVLGLDVEGFGWVTDLTARDPTYILPVISGLTFIMIFEVCCKSLLSTFLVMKPYTNSRLNSG